MKNRVGSKIKELRKNSRMTQSELAGKLGISASAVGMYEQGRRQPDSAMILKICSVFGVSADYLLGKNKSVQKHGVCELSEVFDEFTQVLSSQQGLMFDGVPLNEEDKKKIVDAIRAVAALAKQHRKESFG